MLTTDVDDFPGFPEGIQGPDLMANTRRQAERFGTRFVEEDVVSVDFSSQPRFNRGQPLTIKTETQEIKTSCVIIATGASAMWLGIPSEQKFIGHGVSACAVCDGLFFKGKDVIVVGGGDTAVREAQHLSKICRKVYVVHRRGELRAQAALQDLLNSKLNVEYILNSVIEEYLGADRLTAVKLKNTLTGEFKEMPIDGVFVAIGHRPNTKFLEGHLELDEKGYIKVSLEVFTSRKGVFVAGDVSDLRYRQAVTAAGAGCKAAFEAESFLEKLL